MTRRIGGVDRGPEWCANPVCSRGAQRAGFCDPCYVYKRRHKGRMRPLSVIVETGRKQLERDIQDPAWAVPIRREIERALGTV